MANIRDREFLKTPLNQIIAWTREKPVKMFRILKNTDILWVHLQLNNMHALKFMNT